MAGSSGARGTGVAMKALPLSVAFEVVSRIALAQSPTDAMADLRACSQLEREERLECLDNLLRNIAPARPVPGSDNWIISETTSPVDYTPIITATTFSHRGSNDYPMQLSIRCRAGRTELVVAGPVFARDGKDHAISYRIDDNQPVHVAGAPPSSGTGVAFTGDVVRLLQSLPEQGELAIRIVSRPGAAQEGLFSLGGLKLARQRLATVCRWPHAVAGPRN
ncbi:hypothetical protein CQ10_19645 [Bradyrhizobium valentinum]|uniref:Type VI secretion protein n=3 Tax=Bradyrhizobium valentinum TaxID=1518501 RepID=A0A0R3L194_9BRAD|nr:hypothetical protein CQ10_19645 [Bradyrhizobium valentinum]KRR02567.1 hypothetical protein CP49_35720 [Bradyrhizobium valentinum]